MHASVRDNFIFFSAGFEGRMPVMYLDILGLVTTGVGNLIEPVSEALRLPWTKIRGGAAATQEEIRNEWNLTKWKQQMNKAKPAYWRTVASLQLSPLAIDTLVLSKLDQFEAAVRKIKAFAKYEEWPADAQLAVDSMAWAQGAGGFAHFPKFDALMADGKFYEAAHECKLDDHANAGLTSRNAANYQLLVNADAVVRLGMDPATLYYPKVLPTPLSPLT